MLIKFSKFHMNFVEGFMVYVKTFVSLAMPNQYCLDVVIKVNTSIKKIL